jgi:hypothetical protein
MRLIVQSVSTGRFLVPSLDGGEPEWTSDLKKAGGGVFTDPEQAIQLVEDNVDTGDQIQLVDLDRLGTANDYVG